MTDVNELDYVIVTTVSQHRMRYAVPASALKNEDGEIDPTKAVELVKTDKVNEFSQSYMGEAVVDAAAVSEAGILHMFDVDNDYLSELETEEKLDWINRWEYTGGIDRMSHSE